MCAGQSSGRGSAWEGRKHERHRAPRARDIRPGVVSGLDVLQVLEQARMGGLPTEHLPGVGAGRGLVGREDRSERTEGLLGDLLDPRDLLDPSAGATLSSGAGWNRCFPTKAIRGWLYSSDDQHCEIVARYFWAAEGWEPPHAERRTPPSHPGDPLLAVWARRSPRRPA